MEQLSDVSKKEVYRFLTRLRDQFRELNERINSLSIQLVPVIAPVPIAKELPTEEAIAPLARELRDMVDMAKEINAKVMQLSQSIEL